MQLKLKRIIDIILSVIAFVMLSPLLLFISLLVYLSMGRPVLFKQDRSGLRGENINFFKFRSMTNETDEEGNLLPDDERITGLGKFLRATSIDELPQLFNVIKGDMSIVGPRPLPVKYLDLYSTRQAIRHDVRQGITGWCQVHYRGKDRTWEEKLEQDVWYVENWNLWLDIKIIFLTFPVLVRRLLINRKGETTSGEFLGTLTEDTFENPSTNNTDLQKIELNTLEK